MNENNEILLMYQALKGIEERQYYKVYNNRGLCAAFNEKGNQLTDFKYIDMRYVGGNHEAFTVATQNGDNGIIGICDSTGREIVTPKYEKTNIARGNVFPLKLNNKWGLVNASNNVVYPFEIDKVDPYFNFHNYFDKDEFFLAVSKGDKWALVDDDGALLCDFAFEKDGTDLTSNSAKLNESYHEGMAVARIHKNDEFMYGFFDKSGKLAIPCIYSFACNFCNGLARVENDMDKFGYINKQGETVLPFIYDWAGDFDTTTQTAQVRIGIKHLVINTKGEVVANKW